MPLKEEKLQRKGKAMTDSVINTFNFDGSSVRVIAETGKPLFCAVDVCKILGHTNPSRAIKLHCREDGLTKRYGTDELGRQQEYTFITEGNLYRLIVKSKLESAQKFESWVFDDVLPTIRVTGGYVSNQKTCAPALPNFMDPADAAIAWAEQYRKAQALEAQAKKDAPKIDYANAVDGRGKGVIIELVAKKLDVKPQWLRKFMREEIHWLRLDGAPMEWAKDCGYLTYKDWIIPHNSGIQQIKTTSYVTGKGEIRLAQLIAEYKAKQATGGLFEEKAA